MPCNRKHPRLSEKPSFKSFNIGISSLTYRKFLLYFGVHITMALGLNYQRTEGNSGCGVSNFIYRLTRWGLGCVFIYAGSIKLLAPAPFAALIEAYGIVPEGLTMLTAIVLAALEVAAGIGLLFDVEGSLAVIAGLLLLFIAVMGYGIWLGLEIDCGCFGPGDPEAEAFHGLRQSLYRDLVMLAGVAFIYGWRRYHTITPVKANKIAQKLIKKWRNGDAPV